MKQTKMGFLSDMVNAIYKKRTRAGRLTFNVKCKSFHCSYSNGIKILIKCKVRKIKDIHMKGENGLCQTPIVLSL